MHEYVTRLELYFAFFAMMAGWRLGIVAYPKVKVWLQQTKIQRLIKRAYPSHGQIRFHTLRRPPAEGTRTKVS